MWLSGAHEDLPDPAQSEGSMEAVETPPPSPIDNYKASLAMLEKLDVRPAHNE